MDEHAQRAGWSRRSMLAGAAAGLVTPLIVNGSAAPFSVAAAAQAKGKLRQVTIYAEPLAGGLVGYGLEPGGATIPGPLLEIYEGDTLEIELVNNTDQRLSIHPHGVDYDTASDGSPLNASFNEPGQTRVYTWRTRTQTKASGGFYMPGSAGYWHYHDHAMGDHGTTGIAKGLYGGLIVRKSGDLLPDKQFTAVFNEMSINNKMAPDTPMFEANHGQRVEFVCVGHGNQLHTFHLHAHRWADTRTGMLHGDNDHTDVIDNKDLNPGSSFGFQVIAGDGVGPGVWMYHCHVQFHVDGGMVGLFLVRNSDGSLPAGAQDAIDRFHDHQHAVANKSSSTAGAHTGH